MHDGEESDKDESVEEEPIHDSEEEMETHVVQTGTKPKKKSKKKKQHNQHVENVDDEFLVDIASNGCEPTTITRQVPAKNVLTLEQKNLNPDNELKKIFGSKVVLSAQKKKARGRAYVKSTWLINAKDNWSQIRKTG